MVFSVRVNGFANPAAANTTAVTTTATTAQGRLTASINRLPCAQADWFRTENGKSLLEHMRREVPGPSRVLTPEQKNAVVVAGHGKGWKKGGRIEAALTVLAMSWW